MCYVPDLFNLNSETTLRKIPNVPKKYMAFVDPSGKNIAYSVDQSELIFKVYLDSNLFSSNCMNLLPIRPRHGVRKEIRCLEGGTYQFESASRRQGRREGSIQSLSELIVA